jgi:hypothetical protein
MPHPKTPASDTPDAMLEHRIRQRAYEIYEAKLHRSDLQDWLQAEREVLDEISGALDQATTTPGF